MNERDNNRTITCPACGAESSDLEWCENCGASLGGQELGGQGNSAQTPEKLWLEPGDTISFKLPRRSGKRPPGAFSAGSQRRQEQTRRDLPRLKKDQTDAQPLAEARESSADEGSPEQEKAQDGDGTTQSASPSSSAFEMIGPDKSGEGEGDKTEPKDPGEADEAEGTAQSAGGEGSGAEGSEEEQPGGEDPGERAGDGEDSQPKGDSNGASSAQPGGAADVVTPEEDVSQKGTDPSHGADEGEAEETRQAGAATAEKEQESENGESGTNDPEVEESGTNDSGAEDPGTDEVKPTPVQTQQAKEDASSPGQQLTVKVESVREAYSQRRLWDVVELESNTRYVLEERRLAPNEAPSRAVEFQPVDELTDRWVFNMLARKSYHKRILTLFEAPQGESLEAWRRDGGDNAATADAIIQIIRPIVEALEAIHSEQRLHLHLNPRTVWVDEDRVGFTGIDRLETIPVQGNRFRATVGFSAPELFGRSKQKIDTHADIYSLGAITFYLITGIIPPVAPETAFAPAIGARDFRPAFPVGWSEVILKATDPVPNRRYATAAAFLSALESGFTQMKVRRRFDEDVRYFAAAERHIGFSKQQRSPINQDNVFVAHDKKRNRMLLAVADGVSTASFGSGDLASGFLANRAEEAWNTLKNGEEKDPVDIINGILHMSNQDIVDYVNDKHSPLDAPPSEVMGSTALIAWVEDGIMTLASLGDSRCYLIRPDMMECVTRDHNLFTLSLIEGLGIDEVLFLPHGDALARCLGTFDVSSDGHLTAVDPPADFYQLRLIPGDNLLLCTDGLFDYAGSTYEESEAHIRRRVLADTHPGLACLELILLANRGGGGDNIGVALLKVMPESGLHQ